MLIQLLLCAMCWSGRAAAVERDATAGQGVASTDTYDALVEEYVHGIRAWRLARRPATSSEQREEHRAAHPGVLLEPRFSALVEQGEGRALLWMAETVQLRVGKRAEVALAKERLYRRLFTEYIDAPWLSDGIEALFKDESSLGLERVEVLALAIVAGTKVPASAAASLLFLAQEYQLLSGDANKARCRELYEQLVTSYPESRQADGARDTLYALRHLSVGVMAQDFEGRTVDGESFRLRDYRGKVVLLDFWGFWCGPCRRDLPLLAQLVEQFDGQDFAVLGVNTDDDKDDYRENAAKTKVNWINAFDGGPAGPICRAWRIGKFPSKYLIDRAGRLRYRNLQSADLARRIEQLLAEELPPEVK